MAAVANGMAGGLMAAAALARGVLAARRIWLWLAWLACGGAVPEGWQLKAFNGGNRQWLNGSAMAGVCQLA